MSKYQYGTITNLILNGLSKAFIELGSWTMGRYDVYTPLGEFIKQILEEKNNKITKRDINLRLKRLEKQKIIEFKEKDNQVYIVLKNKGKNLIVKRSIKLILDFKKKKKIWNGKWFIVFFDVPENERVKRDYLRKLLKYLGFYQYQKSVYIFPYECEKEINLIKKIVDGSKYMRYIIAEKIEEERKIKRYFNLI